MDASDSEVVPGTERVLIVHCADGSVSYCFQGMEPGWEIPASLASLTPAELRAIAEHKQSLLVAGFTQFS